jgi:hypothetical protein
LRRHRHPRADVHAKVSGSMNSGHQAIDVPVRTGRCRPSLGAFNSAC